MRESSSAPSIPEKLSFRLPSPAELQRDADRDAPWRSPTEERALLMNVASLPILDLSQNVFISPFPCRRERAVSLFDPICDTVHVRVELHAP